MYIILLLMLSSAESDVILNGSSEYAVPGTEFILTCDVPEEANLVKFYRRPDVTTPVGGVQVAGDQCYNTKVNPAVPCTLDVCSCVTSGGLGTVFRWIIEPQTGDHGSEWYCRRTKINLPIGNQELDSADYTLIMADGPGTSIALSPPDTTYTRTEGDTLLDITCTAGCRPGCTFVWTRPDNTNFTVSPVLSLGQLKRSENGSYRCTARNVVGESIVITRVTVQYGPSTVSLTPQNVTYTPTEGQTIPTITCSADCNPACTYIWTKDGQSYTTGSGLQLTNIQRGQGGVYRCTARNNHGTDVSVTVNISVNYGPNTSIALSPTNTTYTKTEGGMLPDITCTANCRPNCTIVWTGPDNTNFTGSPVLSLGQLDRSNHGTYRCTARNVVGESTIITSVTVQYGPGTSIAISPGNTTYTKEEGDKLPDITCTANCRPGCTFVWTRPDNTNFTLSSMLTLEQLDRSEHGTYRCTARNVVGESTIITSVSVQYGPSTVSLTPPTVTYTPTEGETIPTVTCSADCNPVCTYSWTKDGQAYTTGSGLQITNIRRDQGGVYRCTVSNEYGSARGDDVSITVYYGPGTSIAMSPTDTTYTKTEGYTLPNITCTADCRPGCTFVWTRPDNTNFTVSPVLSLGQLNRSENGTYRCTARNAVGESTVITSVSVQFPPHISGLNFKTGDGNLIEGSSTSVVCTVESFPASTIQWFYKANNALLQTTTDVLDSTYSLNNAACLDTGVYTCSVRNSVSNTAVTRSIDINVLCKPREDLRVNYNHKVGLATSENMTVTAFFLANPVPDFIWTFQNATSAIRTDLVNGTDNFIIRNSFGGTNLSAVSIGIRKTMQEHWFGTYNVTATNSQGSGRISFIVEAKGKPNPPYEGTVICPFQDKATLSWRSAFDGGSTQTFVVGRRSQTQDIFVIDRKLDTPDPGQHRTANISVSGLAADTQHFFMVYAVNEFGNATMEDEVNCTTKAMPAPEASTLGPILGAVGGSAAAVIVVIVVVVIVVTMKRKSVKNKRDDNVEMIPGEIRSGDSSDGLKPNILYESSDGLKANILYETSDPEPGTSSEYAVVQKKSKTKPVSPNAEYAIVDKSKKETSKPTNDVYAEVVKPAGKGGKAKRKQGKKKEKGKGSETKGKDKTTVNGEDVYEKIEDTSHGASGNIYANCQNGATPVSDKGPTRKRNQDGLIYLDIEFKDKNQNGSRNYVIHGIENRTDYADVDFTKHADPIPLESEDPQQSEGTDINN